MIKATEVVESIAESEPIGSVLPKLESQVRELVKSDNPPEAWREAQEANDTVQPTAQQVKKTVEEKGIDTRVSNDKPAASAGDDTDISPILSILGQPYKLGEITGTRRQLNTNVDDVTINRLNAPKDRLHPSGKGIIIAQSLLLMERLFDLQDSSDSTPD